MRKKMTLILILSLVIAGCFDQSIEINIKPDGSGIISVWITVDRAEALLVSVISNHDLEAEKKLVLQELDSIFDGRDGLGLINHDIISMGEDFVLRYRFWFDSPDALNKFMSDPNLEGQVLLPTKGEIKYSALNIQCGKRYDVSFALPQRPAANLIHFGNPSIDNLSSYLKGELARKFYSGRFHIWMTMPGQIRSVNQGSIDPIGRPVRLTTVRDALVSGINLAAISEDRCEDLGQKAEPLSDKKELAENLEILTQGPAPNFREWNRSAFFVPHVWNIHMDIDASNGVKASYKVIFQVKNGFEKPFESYLPILLMAFPQLEGANEIRKENTSDGDISYIFAAKEKVNLQNTGSRLLFLGKEEGKYVFRANLPNISIPNDFFSDSPGIPFISVKVKMPREVVQTNGIKSDNTTVFWSITDKMMIQDRITLEAITK